MLEDYIWLLRYVIIAIKVIVFVLIVLLITVLNIKYIDKRVKKANLAIENNEFTLAKEIYKSLIKNEFFDIKLYINYLYALFLDGDYHEFDLVIDELKQKKKSTQEWIHMLYLGALLAYVFDEPEKGDKYLKESSDVTEEDTSKPLNTIDVNLLVTGIKCFYNNEMDDSVAFLSRVESKEVNPTLNFICDFYLCKIYGNNGENDLYSKYRKRLNHHHVSEHYKMLLDEEVNV